LIAAEALNWISTLLNRITHTPVAFGRVTKVLVTELDVRAPNRQKYLYPTTLRIFQNSFNDAMPRMKLGAMRDRLCRQLGDSLSRSLEVPPLNLSNLGDRANRVPYQTQAAAGLNQEASNEIHLVFCPSELLQWILLWADLCLT